MPMSHAVLRRSFGSCLVILTVCELFGIWPALILLSYLYNCTIKLKSSTHNAAECSEWVQRLGILNITLDLHFTCTIIIINIFFPRNDVKRWVYEVQDAFYCDVLWFGNAKTCIGPPSEVISHLIISGEIGEMSWCLEPTMHWCSCITPWYFLK